MGPNRASNVRRAVKSEVGPGEQPPGENRIETVERTGECTQEGPAQTPRSLGGQFIPTDHAVQNYSRPDTTRARRGNRGDVCPRRSTSAQPVPTPNRFTTGGVMHSGMILTTYHPCRGGGTGRRNGLVFERSSGNRRDVIPQSQGILSNGNPEPSPRGTVQRLDGERRVGEEKVQLTSRRKP